MTAEITVAPGLLIAMPQLADPNFHRSVVLMVRHGREGSFGLILNRPTEQNVKELLTPLEISWQGRTAEKAWWGGPVEEGTGWILHEPIEGFASESTAEIAPGIHLSWGPEDLRRLADKPPRRVRLVLGYAGWGPEQLESELSEGAWVNSDVTPELVFDTPAQDLWKKSVQRIGIEPEALVPAHGVH
jgi:putative transcriptional regulator